MNVADIEKKVAYIESIKDDDEAAHGTEDGLRQEVLEAIATGTAENPAECAAAALRTSEIDFYRWCA